MKVWRESKGFDRIQTHDLWSLHFTLPYVSVIIYKKSAVDQQTNRQILTSCQTTDKISHNFQILKKIEWEIVNELYVYQTSQPLWFSFLRVTNSEDPKAFHGLFRYLEDNVIYKDKAGKLICTSHILKGVEKKTVAVFL